jgi:hypothetical protein
MPVIVIIVIVGVIAIPLAIILIRFNRKRLHIIRCARGASPAQLEAIYTQIDKLGTESSSCAVLARTNRSSGGERDWIIPVPCYVDAGAGRAITADAGPDVAFRFSMAAASEPILRGQAYRIVPVPRHMTKSGKARNQFAPSKYAAHNPELLAALRTVCPAYPADLLSFLLAAGAETFEFDPMFQVRLGGNPSWVQDAEYPRCDECKRRMNLILQLPGALLPGKPLPEGTFYFFGCVKHSDKTKTVGQFA